MFKKVNKKPLRKRQHESSSDDEDSGKELEPLRSNLDNLKGIQKLRKRAHGVNLQDLGNKDFKIEEADTNDPFKLKTGGIVNMKGIRKKDIEDVDELQQIGTTFAAETNRRDEDGEMLKYVEEEMKKHKGLVEEDKGEDRERRKSTNPEDLLYQLPEHIEALGKKKTNEDMLSNQMLSGIPEVDLGIEMKIANIEATEEAKAKLLSEKKKKQKEGLAQFVPTNMAVNFVQHNRFNMEDSHAPKSAQKQEAPKPAPVRVGDVDRLLTPTPIPGKSGHDKKEKSTDCFHYEKFKKQMRRY